MNLFDQAHQERIQKESPLAARMRPRTLDEYIGQEHIIGPGRLLRRAIQADQLSSLIFYGPPGTGKTTLAQVIANSTKAHFIALNAVLAGVQQIREAIADAQDRRKMHGQRTILFVDEVHRFNKAQQDALLPWVENGTVIFVGATTENPYFEVNKALVSRSRIFQLTPLTEEHLRRIVYQALGDRERGYGNLQVVIDEDALDHLVNVANGDARAVLNALELAVETTQPDFGLTSSLENNLQLQTVDSANKAKSKKKAPENEQSKIQSLSWKDPKSKIHITLAVAEESIQRRAVLYDKEGDYHFDTISAFIKSLRGSDADAALYWMAKMVYAGEAPRFIFRRMLIFAGEDVGMADPNAIQVVTACAQAFEQVGMPEGRFHLSMAALYLATAKKSNTTMAFFDALEQVSKEGDSGVPNHLKDASRDKEGFGHGEGYLYPHAFRDHWIAQQYLPTSLQGKVFYQPSDQGYEAQIRVEVARKREEQLAAMMATSEEETHIDILTFSPDDPARERWLQRTLSNTGARLGKLRDRVLDAANLARHSLVLDLKAGSGLLTWEAVRRTPEGGVYALARTEKEAEALRQQAARLHEVERPQVVALGTTSVSEWIHALAHTRGSEMPSFDAMIGYNTLLGEEDKAGLIQAMAERLSSTGVISLADRVPRYTQRLYHLVDRTGLDAGLVERWIAAEEAIYQIAADALVNWDETMLADWFHQAGLAVTITLEEEQEAMQITSQGLARWFTPSTTERASYVDHLAKQLSLEEVAKIKNLFERQLLNQSVQWGSRVVYSRT